MGNSSSTNSVTNSISLLSSVYNTSTQQCAASSSQSIGINIINSAGTKIEDNEFIQLSESTTNCLQKVSYDAALTNSLDQQVQQSASTSMAMVKANVGSQTSSNILRNTINLSNIINNAASQQCTPSSTQSFMLNIINSPDSTFSKNIVKQTSKSIVDCTQGVATKSTAANDLSMVVSQVSKNTQETLTGMLEILLIFAAVCVLGFVVVGGFGGSTAIKQMFDWKTLLAVGVLIIFILAAYLWYQSRSQDAIQKHMEVKAEASNTSFNKEAKEILSRIYGTTSSYEVGARSTDEFTVQSLNGSPGGIKMPIKLDDKGLIEVGDSSQSNLEKYYNGFVGYYWLDPKNPKATHFTTTDYPGPYVQGADKYAASTKEVGLFDRTGAFPEKSSNSKQVGTQASYIRIWADKYGCAYDNNECDWSIVLRTGPSRPRNLVSIIQQLLQANIPAVVPNNNNT